MTNYEKNNFLIVEKLIIHLIYNIPQENVHSKARHKLSIHVISTASSPEKNLPNTTEKVDSLPEDIKKIEDIMSFKNSQTLYPLLKPFEKYFPRKGIRSSKL